MLLNMARDFLPGMGVIIRSYLMIEGGLVEKRCLTDKPLEQSAWYFDALRLRCAAYTYTSVHHNLSSVLEYFLTSLYPKIV